MKNIKLCRSLSYGFASLIAATTIGGGVIAGCGGSRSNSTVATPSSTGRLILVTRWPDRSAPTRLIPVLTDELSFEVIAVASGASLASIRVARPDVGNESVTEIPAIPPGDVRIRVRAWKSDSTVALASGIGQATVTAGNVTQTRISLASTITQIKISPTAPEIRQLAQVQHTVTATDASGAIVPISPEALQWSSSASSVATINGTGLLVAVAAGNTRIAVKDPESGKEASYDTTVIPNDPKTQIPPTYVLTEFSRFVQRYPIVDVHAINDQGQVVGDVLISDGPRQGFFWENGVYTLIPHPQGTSSSTARDINNRGQVVGGSSNMGYIWERGTMITFKISLPTNNTTYSVRGTAINESGTVVGIVSGNDAMYVFRRMADGVISLSPLFYVSGVFRSADVNEANDAAFTFFGDQPVLWRADGSFVNFKASGTVSAINDNGVVVGAIPRPSGLAAFWNPDRTELPGSLYGMATDINNGGLVVGFVYPSYNANTPRAFVTRTKGNPVFLNTLPIVNGAGWTFTSASGINSNGQIVGKGTKDGIERFFLLTPKFD